MRTAAEVESKILEARQNIAVLSEYLHNRIKQSDWHGVEDAASDIRDNEAALRALHWVLGGKLK